MVDFHIIVVALYIQPEFEFRSPFSTVILDRSAGVGIRIPAQAGRETRWLIPARVMATWDVDFRNLPQEIDGHILEEGDRLLPQTSCL